MLGVVHESRSGVSVNVSGEPGDAKAGDRREQIRTLAAEMFFERGYESTSIRDLAAALDIKAASLYYHFPDKEQILFELVGSVLEQLLDGARALVGRQPTSDLALAAIVVNHVVLHALRPKETTLGDSELRSLTGERLAVNVRTRDAYERVVVEVLERGAAEGAFDVIDVKLTAYALIAQSSHVGTWYQPDGRLPLERIADIHVGLALRMVAAPPIDAAQVERLVQEVRDFHEQRL
jgi:TetR/AcrR family transcriptional regulator, cholesterol catabolism regulator